MKKIICLLLSVLMILMFSGCKQSHIDTPSDYNKDSNSSFIDTNKSNAKEKIELNPFSYEKGFNDMFTYYNRWLNFYIEYNFDNDNDTWLSSPTYNIYESDAYIESQRYYGGNKNQTPELEWFSAGGLKNAFIGIYTQNCNGKSLQEMIEKMKKSSKTLLENELKNRSGLHWQFEKESEIVICGQKYILSTLEISEITKYGDKPWYSQYTYWDFYAIKDNKFVNIHCSGLTGENNIEMFLDCFKPIGSVRKQINFGEYEQNKNNKKECIEWIVLEEDVNNKRALVISKKALDYKPFSNNHFESASKNKDNHTTYEESYIRYWLNTKFIDNAFSSKEKNKIIATDVLAEKNPEYDTSPGNNTVDLIFLLSISEYNKYFSEAELNCQFVSNYTKDLINQKHSNSACGIEEYYRPWVRNPGPSSGYASVMYSDTNYQNAWSYGIVYPAMWVSLE